MPAGYTQLNDTGNGATISFADTGFVGSFKMIGEVAQEGGDVEDSALENDEFKSFIPTDLIDPGTCECEILFDVTKVLPVMHKPELITISLPRRAATGARAQFVASGFIKKRTLPQFANGTLQTSKITIRFDGKATKPAFTVGV
jgi:hypothetical protein